VITYNSWDEVPVGVPVADIYRSDGLVWIKHPDGRGIFNAATNPASHGWCEYALPDERSFPMAKVSR